jgi:dolichol-phosphate mannosyltransferase
MISLVVPIYNEEKNIGPFLGRTLPLIKKTAHDYELIFCLDPSRDATEQVVLEEREKNPMIKLLKFSRRVGQPMATLAGLQYSSGDAVMVMDVDMQDPPELIGEMIAKWKEGYDVVIPQRRRRTGEPWIKKVVAETGYKVINKIADVSIPPNTGDFRLLSRRVVNELVKLKECHGFLRGMVAVVGFRQCLIPFDRPGRAIGETKYNRFLGSLKIGFNGIFCFSTFALTLSTQIGFLVAGGAILLAGIYLFLKIINYPILWGNPTLVILMAFLGGVQLISIGILGEYIGRIYEEVRMRPKYIIDRSIGF